MNKFFSFIFILALALSIGSCSRHVHTWDSGTVTIEPTCEQRGEIVYNCTGNGCKNQKVEDLGFDMNNPSDCELCNQRAEALLYAENFTRELCIGGLLDEFYSACMESPRLQDFLNNDSLSEDELEQRLYETDISLLIKDDFFARLFVSSFLNTNSFEGSEINDIKDVRPDEISINRTQGTIKGKGFRNISEKEDLSDIFSVDRGSFSKMNSYRFDIEANQFKIVFTFLNAEYSITLDGSLISNQLYCLNERENKFGIPQNKLEGFFLDEKSTGFSIALNESVREYGAYSLRFENDLTRNYKDVFAEYNGHPVRQEWCNYAYGWVYYGF